MSERQREGVSERATVKKKEAEKQTPRQTKRQTHKETDVQRDEIRDREESPHPWGDTFQTFFLPACVTEEPSLTHAIEL